MVVRGGEGALQVLPPLVDIVPEARFNLVAYHLKQNNLSAAHALVNDITPVSPQDYIIKAVANASMAVSSDPTVVRVVIVVVDYCCYYSNCRKIWLLLLLFNLFIDIAPNLVFIYVYIYIHSLLLTYKRPNVGFTQLVLRNPNVIRFRAVNAWLSYISCNNDGTMSFSI